MANPNRKKSLQRQYLLQELFFYPKDQRSLLRGAKSSVVSMPRTDIISYNFNHTQTHLGFWPNTQLLSSRVKSILWVNSHMHSNLLYTFVLWTWCSEYKTFKMQARFVYFSSIFKPFNYWRHFTYFAEYWASFLCPQETPSDPIPRHTTRKANFDEGRAMFEVVSARNPTAVVQAWY